MLFLPENGFASRMKFILTYNDDETTAFFSCKTLEDSACVPSDGLLTAGKSSSGSSKTDWFSFLQKITNKKKLNFHLRNP